MPRPPRPQFPEAIYHVTTRGNRGATVYVDAIDSQFFIRLLELVGASCGWRCHAFCLMTTHYHLLVTTPAANIATGMHALNGRYAQAFNARHGLDGHVFGRRYAGTLVEDDSHLLEVYRYIAWNPVRAGLCTSPADWPWSSYSRLVRREIAVGESESALLAHFGTGRQAIEKLRAFVEYAA